RLAVIACNTASTIALSAVRAALDIPVVGTVPAIKPAALLSKSRVFGVLGTDATVRQPYVDRLTAEFGSDCTVLRHGSAALVQLAESKLRGEVLDPVIARDALAGLLDQPSGALMDTVVLACTHFPLVEAELAAAAPHPLRFVHGGDGIARRIAYLTQGQDWPEAALPGTAIFTRLDEDVESLRPALGTYGLERIEEL
ncbi:MAG TPA: aspartate/glutamate racemase family protein, partial [Sphingobium sp.]|nr:aspartate/glutamate racemase family protein [Sphingobium sp.]